MRNSIFLQCAALSLAALLPAARAQFQPPSEEELKMTAGPKAPGAAAVYLDLEEVANDPLHYQSHYARIKVLAEKGKDLATVELPYLKGGWKISDIKGRTIHPDGAIVELTAKPEDLLNEKTGALEIGRKVFTLPSVEVGSILEYSYSIRFNDNEFSSPSWEIQRPYFVHRAHYSFTPFKAFMPDGVPGRDTNQYLVDARGREVHSLIWWGRLPAGVSIKTSMNGSYTVDVTDVPPIPDEAWMPPIQSLLYRVNFYYCYTANTDDFWTGEARLWAKDVDNFAGPSNIIRGAVMSLVAPGDSDLDKARKLYVAVQALDNTDYSRHKTQSEMKELKIKQPKHAQDTWTEKSGSSEDIAMLYLAMLRTAELTAYAVKVVNRNQGFFDKSFMSLSQLDTTLVVLSTGGQKIVLDPGEKMCPFQTVNWLHSDTGGIGQSAEGIAFTMTPAQLYTSNTETRIASLTLDARGGVTGHAQIIMVGQTALRWRQAALRNDETEIKKQFDRELDSMTPDGVVAHVDHFLGLDQPDQNLIAIINFSGALGTATAKRLMLPGLFFESRANATFVNEEKRQIAIDMQYGDRVTDDVTWYLPAELSVEGAPQDASISWPGHAIFMLKSVRGQGQIKISNSLARAFTLATPGEYQDLRGFYQKVDAAEQVPLILTKAPPAGAAPDAKGN